LAHTRLELEWHSRGYIPHLDAPSLVQHVVFRLADSLPVEIRNDLAKQSAVDRIRMADAALDQGHGRRDLENPLVARLVQAALLKFDGERYALVAWCVMPNHVHALLQLKPGFKLDRVVHSWKSYTAKEANRLLRCSGAFWAPEYFDRFMRDDEHLARTASYIEGDPVKAGLCANISEWRFSSASQGRAGETPAVPNEPLRA
jgi:REP element-mobilizing transposase RayT